jgi:hypothetical protein
MQEPFNPIPLPNLNLTVDESPSVPVQTKSSARPKPKRRISRTGQVRRVLDPKAAALRIALKVSGKAKTSWRQIKGGITSRLARLDPGQLKRVLLACGVASTVALVIIALAKHMALIVVLLAVLGALVVLKLWNRLLTLGI